MPFEIGDRVVCTSNHQRSHDLGPFPGQVGTVRSITGLFYGVQFDEPFHDGHDLHSRSLRPPCPMGHGWFVFAESLELERDAGAGSIGEFFKRLEKLECTSSPCSS